ncbi:hypothetical protein FZ983_33280 [Azospirillum sp. B21]|nr:hypothetical protein FZ983_33280 [Azospirillum sp. B21]
MADAQAFTLVGEDGGSDLQFLPFQLGVGKVARTLQPMGRDEMVDVPHGTHSADGSGSGQWWNLVAGLFESYLNYNYLLSNQIPLNKPSRSNQTPLCCNQIPVNRLGCLGMLCPVVSGMKRESEGRRTRAGMEGPSGSRRGSLNQD